MKPLLTMQTPIDGPTCSWWLGLNRAGFAAKAETEKKRIRRGRFGSHLGSPTYGDEDGSPAMTKPGRRRESP